MFLYRIALAKYSYELIASGRAARWNPNDIDLIYTASSRSLACLENVVHRSEFGLSMAFNIMTIEAPENIKITHVKLNDLPPNWREFNMIALTQQIGEEWSRNKNTAVLAVPSSIIEEEVNYLLNPHHNEFKFIKLNKNEPFAFDSRIKN